MFRPSLKGAWLDVPANCPMRCDVNDTDHFELAIGDLQDCFEVVLARKDLEKLISVASTALAGSAPVVRTGARLVPPPAR